MKHKPVGVIQVDPFQIEVTVFENFNSMRKFLKKEYNHKLCKSWKNSRGLAHRFESNGLFYHVLMIAEGEHLGTVVHECSHMVDYILERCNRPGDIHNTEIRAYLLDTMFINICALLGRPTDAI